MKRYSATEARNNFGEIIEETYHTGKAVIVERRNKPLVAIVPLTPIDQAGIGALETLPSFTLGSISGSLSRDDIYEENGR